MKSEDFPSRNLDNSHIDLNQMKVSSFSTFVGMMFETKGPIGFINILIGACSADSQKSVSIFQRLIFRHAEQLLSKSVTQ